MPCGLTELLAIAGIAGTVGKTVAGLASKDNPSPAPIKLTQDQTGAAKMLGASFGSGGSMPGLYQANPNQAGYTPIGSLGQELGAGVGGPYAQRLQALQNHLGGAMGAPMPMGTQQLQPGFRGA